MSSSLKNQRRLRGEELHHLSIDELHQLEKSLESGLGHVVAKKGEVIMNEFNRLQEKGLQLMEENEQLRQMVDVSNARKQIHTDTENVTGEEGPASESFTNSAGASQDYDCSYTSLKLGAMSLYITQSGSITRKTKLKWVNSTCPCQP